MTEASRLLRYLIPGTLYFLVTVIGVLGFWPERVIAFLTGALVSNVGSAVFVGVGFVVTSGTLGFLLSMIHHLFSWQLPNAYGAVNYQQAVIDWQREGLIEEKLKGEDDARRVQQAWMIVTKLWFERRKISSRIDSCTERAERNADLVHSVGACRVAWIAGAVTSVFIAGQFLWTEVSQGRVLHRTNDIFVSLGSILLVVYLGYCVAAAHKQVVEQAEDFAIRVLEATLREENNVPVSWQRGTEGNDHVIK